MRKINKGLVVLEMAMRKWTTTYCHGRGHSTLPLYFTTQPLFFREFIADLSTKHLCYCCDFFYNFLILDIENNQTILSNIKFQ